MDVRKYVEINLNHSSVAVIYIYLTYFNFNYPNQKRSYWTQQTGKPLYSIAIIAYIDNRSKLNCILHKHLPATFTNKLTQTTTPLTISVSLICYANHRRDITNFDASNFSLVFAASNKFNKTLSGVAYPIKGFPILFWVDVSIILAAIGHFNSLLTQWIAVLEKTSNHDEIPNEICANLTR